MSKAKAAAGVMSVAEFLQEIEAISRAHRRYENFANFIEAAYCTLAKRTALDEARATALEARYMAIVETYGEERHEAMVKMAQLFGRLVLTLSSDQVDFLGSAFMAGEFRERQRGQYFTPYTVARMMALINFDRECVERTIADGDVVTVAEPTAGTGVMIIAVAAVIRELGFDPAKVMFATLTELDPLCMKMAFLQMAILDIPAVCVLGNSLSLEETERAYTMAALCQPRKSVGTGDQRSAEASARRSEQASGTDETRVAEPVDVESTPPAGEAAERNSEATLEISREQIVSQPDLFDT